jgi:hypothetical protein
MNSKSVLLPLALSLSACASEPQAPQPIPAIPEQRQCPAYPLPPGRPRQAADQDGLSPQDRLIATEQAIQLDELIKWVEAQGRVQPNSR